MDLASIDGYTSLAMKNFEEFAMKIGLQAPALYHQRDAGSEVLALCAQTHNKVYLLQGSSHSFFLLKDSKRAVY